MVGVYRHHADIGSSPIAVQGLNEYGKKTVNELYNHGLPVGLGKLYSYDLITMEKLERNNRSKFYFTSGEKEEQFMLKLDDKLAILKLTQEEAMKIRQEN